MKTSVEYWFKSCVEICQKNGEAWHDLVLSFNKCTGRSLTKSEFQPLLLSQLCDANILFENKKCRIKGKRFNGILGIKLNSLREGVCESEMFKGNDGAGRFLVNTNLQQSLQDGGETHLQNGNSENFNDSFESEKSDGLIEKKTQWYEGEKNDGLQDNR